MKRIKRIKFIITFFILLLIISVITVLAQQPPAESQEEKAVDTGYRIDVPGTITFTVGVKIKGKVEKPQVVIFLPKERSYYRDMKFSYSFENEISKPLPFVPIY